MDEIERTLLVKPEVFVYKIPPRTSAKGYRAADWKLDAPDWTGRLRCIVKGNKCELRLEDRNNGELFASCPIDTYPGIAVEAVTDSSRYFVICIQDAGRKAYIGMGFADRSDSFDLNVTLQDHFKQLKKEDQFTKEAAEPSRPNLDLAFKEGETIRINIPRNSATATSRPKAAPKGGLGVLPPPPGGAAAVKLPGSASSGSLSGGGSVIASSGNNSALADLLGDFDSLSTSSAPAPSQAPSSSGLSVDLDDWGDFAAPATTQTVASGSWEQF